MDLTPTAEERAFRAECRRWLQENLPWEYGRGTPPRFADLADEVALLREWQGKLAAGTWVGVAWPEEYGGRGAGPIQHFIVQEELARAGAPELVGRIGVNLVGPTLLAHGTGEQKARWLPKILRAEELWCQLFSEPDAGSDLANVQTRAEPATAGAGAGAPASGGGDEMSPGQKQAGWVLNGQKVWTSYAQFADWGVCLARTEPEAAKHAGISYLVVDMHADGVEVRPLTQITEDREFNEVFFTDVFVPTEHLVGDLNDGWRVSQSTLAHERGVNPRQQVIHGQLVDELWRMGLAEGALDDHRLRQRLAQAWVEVKVFQLHNLRSLSRLAAGREVGPEGSALKLYWSEMSQRLHDTAMAVVGDAAPLWAEATSNPGMGRWQRSWLYYLASSIFAGTNEIQRNIVGERVLGLPREPAAGKG